MSCVVVGLGSDGVVFAADGICYDVRDGVVMGHVSKIILMPEIGAAMACTGAVGMLLPLRDILARTCFDFGATVEAFASAAEDIHRQYLNSAPDITEDDARVQLTIGGWSAAQQRFETYKVTGYAKEYFDPAIEGMATGEPWRLYPINEESALWGSCGAPPEILKEFGLDTCDDRNLGVLDYAALWVCAARQGSGPREDGWFGVGGFLQIVWITQSKIVSWIAHRWPDEIGKPIDKTVGEKTPAIPLILP